MRAVFADSFYFFALLNPTDELTEVQAKLDELVGDTWLDRDELSDADKTALDAGLAEYQKNPDAGSPWEEVKARIQGKMRR